MKNAGITRTIDQLGRLVVPMEIRKTMHIPTGTPVEIIPDPSSDTITLRPCRIQCVCCGERNEEMLGEKDGVVICGNCLSAMAVSAALRKGAQK